jgi:hypothetical protein
MGLKFRRSHTKSQGMTERHPYLVFVMSRIKISALTLATMADVIIVLHSLRQDIRSNLHHSMTDCFHTHHNSLFIKSFCDSTLYSLSNCKRR